MFSGRAVHRSEGEHRIARDTVAGTLCKIVFPYMLSVTMLLATEIFTKETICKASLFNISAFSTCNDSCSEENPLCGLSIGQNCP